MHMPPAATSLGHDGICQCRRFLITLLPRVPGGDNSVYFMYARRSCHPRASYSAATVLGHKTEPPCGDDIAVGVTTLTTQHA